MTPPANPTPPGNSSDSSSPSYLLHDTAPTDWELQLLCWLGQHGRRRLLRLCRGRFDHSSIHSREAVAWLESKLAADPAHAAALARQLQQWSARVLWHAQLPKALGAIPDPPLALYAQGNPAALQSTGVAVVGARRCSATGAAFAQQMAEQLCAHGLVVISGLALGIDGAAHRGALQARQGAGRPLAGCGPTIAVLGSGLANLHPRAHAGLARAIISGGGLLLSEYSLTQPSYPSNFPERNRLISGLAQGVMVVEAGLRSGSLVTARLALEQGREVLAVPGSVVSPVSAGCHRLIKQGAALVSDIQDVFHALGLANLAGQTPDLVAGLTSMEAKIFTLLQAEPISLDALSHTSGLRVTQLMAVLTRLEVAGFVQRLPQGYIPTPR